MRTRLKLRATNYLQVWSLFSAIRDCLQEWSQSQINTHSTYTKPIKIMFYQIWMKISALSPLNDAHLKLMPAVLFNILRATACLKVYNHLFNLDSMKLVDMQIVTYNVCHGNLEKKYVRKLSCYVKEMKTTRSCTMKNFPSSPTAIQPTILQLKNSVPQVLQQT